MLYTHVHKEEHFSLSGLWAEPRHLFHKHCVYFKQWLTHRNGFVDLTIWQTKWTSHLKEKNWQCFLPVKMELSRENLNFRKVDSTTVNLTAPQYLKIFPVRWLILMTMKCAIFWKICVTQGTSLFQMTSAWCCKTPSEMNFHVT